MFCLEILFILIDCGEGLTSRVQFLELLVDAITTALPDDFLYGDFARFEGSLKNIVQRAVGKCGD